MNVTVKKMAAEILQVTGQAWLTRADVMRYLNVKSPKTADKFLNGVPKRGNTSGSRWHYIDVAEKMVAVRCGCGQANPLALKQEAAESV